MGLLKGIPVTLINKSADGKDAFNRPTVTEIRTVVENVLVAPASQTDTAVISELSLNGKRALYQLAIPKGDTHQWEDAEVEFFGERWKTVGYPTMGIEEMIPLDWNKKVLVERYG
jgi:hypothetical protein